MPKMVHIDFENQRYLYTEIVKMCRYEFLHENL